MFDLGQSFRQADSRDPNEPETFADFDRIVREGLPQAELDRMAEAYRNLRYADGHFDDLGSTGADEIPIARTNRWDADLSDAAARYEKSAFRVTAPVAKAVANKLSEHLYKRPPSRKLRDAKVSEFLSKVYQANGVNAKWQEADRLTCVGGFAAFQFSGAKDPQTPIKVHLWGADQLVVWPDRDDPSKPAAVFAVDLFDGRTRGQLWTRDGVGYYTTRRGIHPHEITRRFEAIGKAKANPYRDANGEGVLPFAFCHFRPPTTHFTSDSPGYRIRELNRYLNFGFDDTAEGVRYLAKPIGIASGVDADWQFPATVRPGMFLKLAAGAIDAGGSGPAPSLAYLASELAWVKTVWDHFNTYLDLSLELEGIPPSTIRMVLAERSGVSILAEQAPLLGWTEQRRRAWYDYERAAASTALSVVAAHLRNHNAGGAAGRFEAAAIDPDLQLQWPRLYVDLPGPERDRADGVRLKWGIASLVDLVMEREDCSEEQAFERLAKVQEHAERLRAMGIAPNPEASGQGFGFPGQDQQQQAIEAAGGGDNPADLDGAAARVNGQADQLSGEGG